MLRLRPKPNVFTQVSWRIASASVMGLTAIFSKYLLYCLNQTSTVGLPGFLDYHERRRHAVEKRGLLTISNHTSVLDDPLIWGVLPIRMACSPSRMRWSLGAHDICFQSKIASTFFRLGQVLPTHRIQHSSAGGLFQPTMTQAICLLSKKRTQLLDPAASRESESNPDPSRGPAAYAENHLCWLHVFPEGRVIQEPESTGAGYFKWGISRLLLESDPAPDVIPMFIVGTRHIMPEDRGWPKWLPRIGASIRIVFGEPLDVDTVFREHRARWQNLTLGKLTGGEPLGDDLKYGEEARRLRIEVAAILREHVVRLAQTSG